MASNDFTIYKSPFVYIRVEYLDDTITFIKEVEFKDNPNMGTPIEFQLKVWNNIPYAETNIYKKIATPIGN